MKNVLLLVHDDSGEEARLQAALDLTRALNGHLTCFDIVQAPVLAGADYMMADAELALLADARDREAANKLKTQAHLVHEDICWDWIDGTGEISQLLGQEAGLTDIIVLNTAFTDHTPPDMRALASDLAMRAARPILAVPAGAHRFEPNGHVLIAWDGSHPVVETVRAITPLLALAETVTMLEIGRVSGPRAEDAAAYLSRHGISTRVDRVPATAGDVGKTLLSEIAKRQPAFCVMGAYGHARVRETLFGGVTRRLLSESPVPLILGH